MFFFTLYFHLIICILFFFSSLGRASTLAVLLSDCVSLSYSMSLSKLCLSLVCCVAFCVLLFFSLRRSLPVTAGAAPGKVLPVLLQSRNTVASRSFFLCSSACGPVASSSPSRRIDGSVWKATFCPFKKSKPRHQFFTSLWNWWRGSIFSRTPKKVSRLNAWNWRESRLVWFEVAIPGIIWCQKRDPSPHLLERVWIVLPVAKVDSFLISEVIWCQRWDSNPRLQLWSESQAFWELFGVRCAIQAHASWAESNLNFWILTSTLI